MTRNDQKSAIKPKILDLSDATDGKVAIALGRAAHVPGTVEAPGDFR